jgi:hypothetical protein
VQDGKVLVVGGQNSYGSSDSSSLLASNQTAGKSNDNLVDANCKALIEGIQ